MQGLFLEDLKLGQRDSVTKSVSARDIELFATVTGDNNPVHLDEAYAATSRFKTRIAHGMLGAGFISAVIGTKLPGPGTIYLGQTLKFMAPVKIGDVVRATVEVAEIDVAKKRVKLKTTAHAGDTLVIDGEATVMVPSKG